MVCNVIVQCELLVISIFQFLRPQKNMKFIHGGPFEFHLNLKKITCTSPYRGECDSKICIFSLLKFWSFCAHKKNLELTYSGHFEY